MFGWAQRLWKWFHQPRLEHVSVILYTRQGCHLCETAWDCLRQKQRQYGFQLAVVDVDTDPDLNALYGEQVPVVLVDGKVRFRGLISPVLLERLLRAEARRSRPGDQELGGA